MYYSKTIRILAILQLCIVFSLLSWHLSYPFMGQLFALKSKKQLILDTMGSEKYQTLQANQKVTIQRYLDDINSKLNHSFLRKLVRSIHILAFEISPIEQMWIIMSILTSLLLLMNYEGAKQIACLLPLIVVCYSLNNRWNGYQESNKEASLFPSEETIVTRFLKKPLSSSILGQQKELTLGWQLFLIEDWAHEKPSDDLPEREKQVETGRLYFQTARILAQATQPPHAEIYFFRRKQPLTILTLYVLWNLFFALVVNNRKYSITEHVKT